MRMKMRKILLLCTVAVACILIVGASALMLFYNSVGKLCPHASFETTVTPPTCASGGSTLYECESCGYSYVADHTPPKDHTMSELKVAATCGAAGYTLHYCECGYSYRSSHTPPLEHSLSAVEHPASCTEQGYVSYDCENCDYEFNSDFCEPLGHNFTSSSARPTATRAGYTDYTCECGYSYRGDYVYYSDILESAYVENQTVLARGIDVSRWNHQIDAASGKYLPIDWEAVKRAGFEFVILKAGSTKSGLEPTFEADYEGARAAGLEIGAYFYTYSTTLEGIEKDARDLLSYIKGKKFEYPIYLDLEDPSLSSLGKNNLSAMCEVFLCSLQENGYYAGLYTNHTWLTTILDIARMVTLFDIWYARYPLSEKPTWNEEKYGKQLGMWQYTESGEIDGLEGSFDLNYAYKDYKEIMQKWRLNGF